MMQARIKEEEKSHCAPAAAAVPVPPSPESLGMSMLPSSEGHETFEGGASTADPSSSLTSSMLATPKELPVETFLSVTKAKTQKEDSDDETTTGDELDNSFQSVIVQDSVNLVVLRKDPLWQL